MLNFQGTHSLDWTGFASAMVISFLPVLVLFLLFQGHFVRALQGAVKE
jgi:ABC-type glycerol-3-phosphate transport system permease component